MNTAICIYILAVSLHLLTSRQFALKERPSALMPAPAQYRHSEPATAHYLPSGRKIILANRKEVESVGFWQAGTGSNACVVVACTGIHSDTFHHPGYAPKRFSLPVNYAPDREQALRDVCAYVAGRRGGILNYSLEIAYSTRFFEKDLCIKRESVHV